MEKVDKFVLVPSDKYQKLAGANSGVNADKERTKRIGKNDVLMDFIRENDKGLLEWNAKGEISYKGKPVLGSNIDELIKDSKRKGEYEPVGDREFYRALAAMEVPKNLIGNEDRWRDIVYYRRKRPLYIAPPPGIPDGRRKKPTKQPPKKAKWIKVK